MQTKYQALGADSTLLDAILTETNIQPAFMSNGIQHCPLFDDFSPPVVVAGVADAHIRYLKSKQDQ